MPVVTPDSSAQAYSTWAKARVFSSLTVQKFLWLEASVGDRKSVRQSPLNVGGVLHHPKALCWARGSLNATACQQTCWRASASLRPSLVRWGPIDNLPLDFNSFHQWWWPIISISTWIHLWGWLMGSGSSGFNWGQGED